MVGIPSQKDEEVEWVLGPEKNLATEDNGARLVDASSNLDIASSTSVSLISSTGREAFNFADGDNDQTLTVDLGTPRLISSISAEFAKPNMVTSN